LNIWLLLVVVVGLLGLVALTVVVEPVVTVHLS
jgi:hypothetical protein